MSARASLPHTVVFPVPLTPTTSTTAGRSPCRWTCSVRSMSGPTWASSWLLEQRPDLLGVPGAGHLDLGAQLLDQLPRGRDAHVGGDQRLLDLVPGLVVEVIAGEQAEQDAAQRRLRPGQPAAQPDQPPGGRRRLLRLAGGRGGGRGSLRGRHLRRRRGSRLGHGGPGGAGRLGGRTRRAVLSGGGAARRRDSRTAAVPPPPATTTTAAMMIMTCSITAPVSQTRGYASVTALASGGDPQTPRVRRSPAPAAAG